MSWLFGFSKPNIPDIPPEIPNAPVPPKSEENKTSSMSNYRFDSAALERAAKAAKELESSSI